MKHPQWSLAPRVALAWGLWVLPAILGSAATAHAGGQEQAALTPNEKKIIATAQAFAAAFNRAEAKAVAALWTEDGSLLDEQGKTIKGRKAIEAEYAALFKQYPGARIDINITSIEFPTPQVAIEDGVTSSVAGEMGVMAASRYTAVHVLKDGHWLMTSVREYPASSASPIMPRLADLQLLVGNWQCEKAGARLRTSVQWIVDKHFLQRTYTVDKDGVTTSSGLQIIGVDPQAGQIRSWSFDATGGHGTGYWTATPEGWEINQVGTLADGTPVSSHDFVIRAPGEDNVLGWRSVERQAGSTPLPDLPEIVLDRVPDKR